MALRAILVGLLLDACYRVRFPPPLLLVVLSDDREITIIFLLPPVAPLDLDTVDFRFFVTKVSRYFRDCACCVVV